MNRGGKVLLGVGATVILWLLYAQLKNAQAAPQGSAPYPLTPSVPGTRYSAADLQDLNL